MFQVICRWVRACRAPLSSAQAARRTEPDACAPVPESSDEFYARLVESERCKEEQPRPLLSLFRYYRQYLHRRHIKDDGVGMETYYRPQETIGGYVQALARCFPFASQSSYDQIFYTSSRDPWRIISLASLAVSVSLLVLFLLSHVFRWELLVYATIFPVFMWLVLGVSLSAGMVRLQYGRWGMIGIWMMITLFWGDGPWSLLRGWPQVPENENVSAGLDPASGLRVISLNCKGESDAIIELKQLAPDIVLLQESIRPQELEQLQDQHFPDHVVITGRDSALLVRGTEQAVTPRDGRDSRVRIARIHLRNNTRLVVASIHLLPSPRRIDFWNLSTWKLFARQHQERREQLQDIYRQVLDQPDTDAVILGGDFNAPAGDRIYEVLEPTLRDSWLEAGRGWGKTSLNRFPIHRIDQVWVDRGFAVKSVVARSSNRSDHRMVVCDLVTTGNRSR